MNNFMFRVRPLKSCGLGISEGGWSAVLNPTGLGRVMIINPAVTTWSDQGYLWNASRWRVPIPGIYRVVCNGQGGGGGAASPTTAPGFYHFGYGGRGGTTQDVRLRLTASTDIFQGSRNNGGIFPGGAGQSGANTYGAGVFSGGGSGGAGSSSSSGASEAQRQGVGNGGDGGTSGGGNPGSSHFRLELVG